MYKIKIAIIGGGYISQICHLPFLIKNNQCEVKAIVEKKKDLLLKVAQKYKIENKLENYKDLINLNLDLDAVYICVNKFSAYEITHFFLKNKIAVFSEKPVAISYNFAKKLSFLSNKNKTPLIVGYMKRHDYGTKIIKRIIDSKKFGKIKSIHYDSLMGNSFPKNYNYIKYKKPFVKVNLKKIVKFSIKGKKKKLFINFLNNHSHGINLIRYYMGIKDKINLYKKDLVKETLYFKFKNKDLKFNYKFNLRGEWNEKVQIFFENGEVTQIFPAPQLKNKSSKVIIKSLKTGKVESYSKNYWSFKSQVDNFISSISKKRLNICNIDSCLDDLKIIEKVFC